jgi:hypothetical protein
LSEAPAEGARRMLDVGGHRVGLFRVGDTLHATGCCTVHPRLRLHRYAVRIEGDEIIVALAHPA